jgi:hypothetical protein
MENQPALAGQQVKIPEGLLSGISEFIAGLPLLIETVRDRNNQLWISSGRWVPEVKVEADKMSIKATLVWLGEKQSRSFNPLADSPSGHFAPRHPLPLVFGAEFPITMAGSATPDVQARMIEAAVNVVLYNSELVLRP